MTGKRGTPEERFWPKVSAGDPDHCWEWASGRNPLGYGRFYNGERQIYAHRWAYEHLRGPIPEGLRIDHLCRNPGCVNPRHLEVVTHKENTLRGTAPTAINARKAVCDRGHPYDEANTYVTPEGHRQCRTCNCERQRRRGTVASQGPHDACGVPDCPKGHYARGLCRVHYRRLMVQKSPEARAFTANFARPLIHPTNSNGRTA